MIHFVNIYYYSLFIRINNLSVYRHWLKVLKFVELLKLDLHFVRYLCLQTNIIAQ